MKNKFHRTTSMRKRMLWLLLLSAAAVILVSVFLSFVAGSSISETQTQDSMKFLLDQMSSEIDRSYMTMINLMDQLAPGGATGNLVTEYLEETDSYQKYKLRGELDRELLGITFVNSDISQICYLDPMEEEIFLEIGTSQAGTGEAESRRKTKEVGQNIFFAIWPADNLYENTLTVSMVQTGNQFAGRPLDIYLKIKLNISSKMDSSWILIQTDEEQHVCYSSSSDITVGEPLPVSLTIAGDYETGSSGKYYAVARENKIGTSLILMLPQKILKQEGFLWKLKIILVGVFSFIAFYLVILAIYRMLGKPIKKLEEEIEKTSDGNWDAIDCDLGIEEFNQVLSRISEMRQKIKKLQDEIKLEEKERIAVETEKLMYQINPHFLLNALYSVQWMAQNEGQTEIRRFVHDLNSILAYNLGKESQTSSLRAEIAIAQKYISIQKSRYDFEVDFQVEEGAYLDSRTIRMLLQPVIENTLHHGLGSTGKMEIRIFYEPKNRYAVITVQDHGEGLSKEKLLLLNQPLGAENSIGENKNGIGLRYVRYILERFYEGKACLTITSSPRAGTKITILLPIQ